LSPLNECKGLPLLEAGFGPHGITIDPSSGSRVGGADPRSDGAAIGY